MSLGNHNEHICFSYNDLEEGLSVSVDHSMKDEEFLTLDVIFEKFEMFLRAAGFDYVRITPYCEADSESATKVWLITKEV